MGAVTLCYANTIPGVAPMIRQNINPKSPAQGTFVYLFFLPLDGPGFAKSHVALNASCPAVLAFAPVLHRRLLLAAGNKWNPAPI